MQKVTISFPHATLGKTSYDTYRRMTSVGRYGKDQFEAMHSYLNSLPLVASFIGDSWSVVVPVEVAVGWKGSQREGTFIFRTDEERELTAKTVSELIAQIKKIFKNRFYFKSLGAPEIKK